MEVVAVEVFIRWPYGGPIIGGCDVPTFADLRADETRRIIAKCFWHEIAADRSAEQVAEFFDYCGGDPVGWITANIELKTR